ncbi:hypothetical protein GBAR_LOCUS13809 [Geodia barretti]|uniref:Uncharacterized protein n=1 Tax=Geodia barretti TaxID=519541 RepID=A0AA35S703_GEOBA|nr:hypothetical protein GBAR_LOCUS13809 [Geodia barretti]
MGSDRRIRHPQTRPAIQVQQFRQCAGVHQCPWRVG